MRIHSNLKRKDLKYIKFDYSEKANEVLGLDFDYHELDTDGWTTRVVTVYKDGTYGFADREIEYLTFLPEVSVYPLSDLALDNVPMHEITKEEFEEVWNKANKKNG